ncbi:hypothetical protein GCM10022419_055090 [Nonomuraea rosea]|uniref:DUF3995 domain-containing protein n=1 Tax=Nonomuraea rosea TaxID=638574 RepID=A0ABP6XHE1_9ACTN
MFALLPTMYSPCGWARTMPGYCEIASSDAGFGVGVVASMVFSGNMLLFWMAVIESTLLIFAFPALLVALTSKWRGRRFTQAVLGLLVAGGAVNVLANALGRVTSSEVFSIAVFEKLPSGDLELPSIWLGFALMAAACALRRAVRQEDKEVEAPRGAWVRSEGQRSEGIQTR